MKYSIANLFFLVLSVNIFAQIENPDAIVIFNKEEQSYSQVKLVNGLYGFEIVSKISRRVRILSPYGLKQFATLYIPTYHDLDFKTELLQLKAQTIKEYGAVDTISKENIKETTLPANVPFLRKYKGKVKSMAFENLEIGDEIQYDYQIKYSTSSSVSSLFNSTTTIISDEYKTLEASYIFNFKNGIQFKGVVVNADAKFIESIQAEKGNTSYSLNIKNIEPYKQEVFSVEEDNQPYFVVDIYKIDDYEPHDNWDDYTKEIKNSDRFTTFFAGITINDLFYECRKEVSSSKKIEKVHELMMTEIKKDSENISSIFNNYHPSLEDANQIFKLLKLLEINGSVLLVKSKYNGAIVKQIVSLRQFDDLLVEFEDGGKTHYFEIFNPFAALDEIPSEYQGTEACKMSYVNKKETVTFSKIPVLLPSNTKANFEYTMDLNTIQKQPLIDCSLHVQKNGQFFTDERDSYLLEIADKEYNAFSKDIEANILNDYDGSKVDFVTLSDKRSMIDYKVNYHIPVSSAHTDKFIGLQLSELVSFNLLNYTYSRDMRSYRAVFPFSQEITKTLIIKAGEGFTIIPNQFLKNSFENEFAFLMSDYTIIAPNTIEVKISYRLKQNELAPSKWPLFLSFIDTFRAAVAQRVIFQK